MDGYEAVEKWQKANNIHHFEMSTKNLEKLVNGIGYETIDEFLSDNPGAQEAIVEFISEWADRIPEWKESLLAETDEDNED